MEDALQTVARNIFEPDEEKSFLPDDVVFKLGFEGSFGNLLTSPRYITSSLLGHMLCIEGIATSCSLVRPKLIRSMHYVEATHTFMAKDYWDSTMMTPMPKGASSSYPTETETRQKLSSEFGLSSFRDYQTVTLQEMPERAPPGQLPRSLDVILDGDLVDRIKPGDRVQIVGVFKAMGSANSTAIIPAHFRTLLVANNIRHLGGGDKDVLAGGSGNLANISGQDLEQIRQVSRRTDLFDLLGTSIAPSIYGHETVKKSLLLMLLGGVEKNLTNGTHIRGDINIMMVGDPSTAKSQLLRYVLSVAPLAIATTGRGSSGVGLTAAVTHDKETGERRLEAGAMVLADRGIVCIDEFDKMSDIDRVAIHEVMEQQTVTISKAGIHTSLNARCSVIAAANPVWGQYRRDHSPQENIRLPDSLLSRFDLLFIVLDVPEEENDRRIAEHVIRMHRYVPPGWQVGVPIPDAGFAKFQFDNDSEEEEDDNDEEEVEVEDLEEGTSNDDKENLAARPTPRAHRQQGKRQPKARPCYEDRTEQRLTTEFLRKYIYYARVNVTPVLTKAASEYITEAYVAFRGDDAPVLSGDYAEEQAPRSSSSRTKKTFPVTPRTLETLIRLATAHAKARLSSRVERKDAKIAEMLIRSCLYTEVLPQDGGKDKKVKVSKKVRPQSSDSEHEDDDDNDSNNTKGGRKGASDDEDPKGKDPLVPTMTRMSLEGQADEGGVMMMQEGLQEQQDLQFIQNSLIAGSPSEAFSMALPSSSLAPSQQQQQQQPVDNESARADIIATLGGLSRDRVMLLGDINFGYPKHVVDRVLLALQEENKVMLLDDGQFLLI